MASTNPRSAVITGWGKCLPPARLSNHDLATLLDTSDAWIVKRTGIRERPISHVRVSDLAHVAASRALACAGLVPEDVDLVILGSCTGDDQMPNTASRVQKLLGACNAGAMDVNTACTSFMYGLSVGSALIKSGAVRNAVVIGADALSQFMDWKNRGPAILFGDGAGAIVLESTDTDAGIVGEVLGCDTNDREMLRINGIGAMFANAGVCYGTTTWDFNGPEIFRQAVNGLVGAARMVLAKIEYRSTDIDLVIPHQANLRIIEAVARRLEISREHTFTNLDRYGNLSSASIPVAISEAADGDRIRAGDRILMPAFGGGLTWSAHVVRWGTRTTPLGASNLTLSGSEHTGLQLVKALLERKRVYPDSEISQQH